MPHCHIIIQKLRERGYRVTPQREMIIETLLHADHHLTAEEIFFELQKRTRASNIATVYRTLELLWKEGFACRNDLGEGSVFYAANEHGPHIHLVCRYCNQIIEADPGMLATFETALRDRYEFAPDLDHLSLFGICAACQALKK